MATTMDSPTAVRKVVVHLRATGDAPILKQAKFKIPGTDKFAKVIDFLRRQLHRDTMAAMATITMDSPTAVRKVVVHLRATGDAPILKQAKFKIPGTDKFAKVIDFLRRQLHRDTMFVYVNSAFSPNPDESVIDLYNNFGFDDMVLAGMMGKEDFDYI